MRKAGEKMGFSLGGDQDMVELDDGTKIKKDQVKDHIKQNYKKKNEFGM